MGMAGIVLASAAYGAYAQHEAGKQQQDLANQNADAIDAQATNALRRGDEQVNAIRRQVRKVQGDQKASYAAQGIQVDSGSPVDVSTDTARLGAVDEMTTRNNAALEAWGFKTQAKIQRFEGVVRSRTANAQAVGTVLNGFGDAYTSYKNPNNPRFSHA